MSRKDYDLGKKSPNFSENNSGFNNNTKSNKHSNHYTSNSNSKEYSYYDTNNNKWYGYDRSNHINSENFRYPYYAGNSRRNQATILNQYIPTIILMIAVLFTINLYKKNKK